jgi:Surface glycan-binding protein B xyloglucan binding domain
LNNKILVQMKNIYKLIVLFTVAFALVGFVTSCNKDKSSGNGEPRIKYVRITNPASSDSLLVGAAQGRLIAIMGENLGGAVEMWFNDRIASLNPTFITNTSIIVNVPPQIPFAINNKLKIIFRDGKILLYNFEVQISKPTVNNMLCEYVLTGEEATIRGDFFYAPVTVTFTGGVTGTIVSVEDRIVKVKVPAGALPGPITVKTNFGETKSNFWFRDTRNIFISSDPFTGWWNASYVVSSPGATDPPKINGNYIRVKSTIGAWAWTEVAGGPASAMGPISQNVPDAAILKPSDYNLKFEVNTVKPYINNVLKINVGILSENNNEYRWLPPYDTKGQWQTVVIPFDVVAASYGAPLVLSPSGYWARLLFHGPGDLDCDIAFDNFRVVPKVLP